MAEEFKIRVGIMLDESSLKSLSSQINGAKIKPIQVEVEVDDRQIASIGKQLQKSAKAQNISFGLDSASKVVNGVARSFNGLLTLQDEIRKRKINLKDLIKSGGSAEEIGKVRNELAGLMNGYNEIYSELKGKNALGKAEINKLNEAAAPKATKQITDSYRELISVTREIGRIKADLPSLIDKEDTEEVAKYILRLDELEEKQKKLEVGLLDNMSTSQLSDYNAELLKIANNEAFQKQQVEAKQTEAAFDELISTLKKIDSMNGDLLKLDKESAEAKELSGQIDALNNKAVELFGALDGKMSDEQLKEFNSTVEDGANKLSLLKARLEDVASAKQMQAELKQTEADVNDLVSTIKKIGSIETKLLNLDDESAEAKQYKTELAGLIQTQDRLLAKLEGRGISTEQYAKIGNAMQEAENSALRLGARLSDVNVKFKNGLVADFKADKFQMELDKVSRGFEKIRQPSNDAVAAYREFTSAHTNLCAALDSGDASIDEIIAANDKYVASLKKVENQLKINETAQRNADDVEKLKLDKQTFSTDIDVWLKKNSAAAEQFGDEIRRLQSRIEKCDRAELNNLKSEFKEITKQAELAGKTGLNFGDSLKQKFRQYASYFAASFSIMEIVQGLRYMAEAVLEVDTAMTGLRRVTDLTAAQYDALYDNMIASAKEYGATLTDIINATSDWVRAGFGADVAVGLAEITTMYQHISDLDYDTAAENLITAYNGFKQELLGLYDGDEVAAVGYIADVFNELDNNFAVTAAGLGEALTRSASALDLAGNSIQESAA